ncbi:MAG: VWA domain-containing protein [Thermoguttaceae bacterium]|nr:VWA domain-containing protein [Thermoguttaceae bacterium]
MLTSTRWLLVGLVGVGFPFCGLALGLGAESAPPLVQTFTDAGGTTYFAAGIQLPAPATPLPADIVLVIDTSATQAGVYREQQLALVDEIVKQAGPEDRILLLAADLRPVRLTPDFAAKGNAELAAAIEKLQKREPLGAMDLEAALGAALAALEEPRSGRASSVIFVGEGLSRANLLSAQALANLVDKSRALRVALTAVPSGPQIDWETLGILTLQTGGVLVRGEDSSPAQLARQALKAAKTPPAYVVDIHAAGATKEVAMQSLPPLRADRPTVIVGTCEPSGALEIALTVEGAAGRQSVSFNLPVPQALDTNGHLVHLVATAKASGGKLLGVADWTHLQQIAQSFAQGVDQTAQLAVQALRTGDLEGAVRLAYQALQNDPENTVAQLVLTAAQKEVQNGGATPQAPAGPSVPSQPPLELLGPEAQPGATLPPPPPDEGRLVADFERSRKLIEQRVTAEVVAGVNAARELMATNPQAAIDNLKLLSDMISRVPELDEGVRRQLLRQVEAALREAARRQTEFEQRRQEQMEIEAAAREQRLAAEALLRRQEQVRQLLERFSSLVEEGRYQEADEIVAAQAERLDPDNPVPRLAMHNARMIGNLEKEWALRVERQRKVLDTLYQAELSHIPFPDEPPVVYPPAEVWQEITHRRKARYSAVSLASEGVAERRINEELRRPTEMQFIDTPLSDAISVLKDRHQIEIQLDQKALRDAGIATDTPVTLDVKGISLRSALKLLLRPLDLSYVIQDEVLMITTPEEAEQRLSIKVYPVGDLVVPPYSPAAMGGMGMFGGFGGWGGMGGMGGWGGGFGGMGGFGGGFGGGWGGGGWGGRFGGGWGGGAWNVPIIQGRLGPAPLGNLLPMQGGGFRAFNVGVPAERAPGDAATSTPSKPAPTLPVKIDANVPPAQFWEDFCQRFDVSGQVLRKIAKDLMDAGEYQHVVALLKTVIRQGPPEPWVYEGLGLAMLAAGESTEEVERALMSGVAFAQTPLDALYVAIYLEKLGLEKRALSLYRQLADMSPAFPEIAVRAMRLAQKLDDVESLKWATVAVLSQAWPEEKKHIWLEAYGTASDLLKRLEAEKREEERRQYLAQLDEAVRRDVVVEVSWVGDADVDMMVEEPAGTVCSLRNPRTTSGGILLGDTFSHLGQAGKELREVYVCPQGFSGTYRVLLQRVWGSLPADRVKVSVYRHLWSNKAQALEKVVTLRDGRALIEFELDQGRRTEPIEVHKLAQAADRQLAISRAVLAQQLAGAVDPGAMASLASSRGGNGSGYVPFIPIVTGGAVGYQPVVVPVTEGTMLFAWAVISADRRYVRVSPMPQFSGIAEVNVFNFVTGTTTGGRGGTGGLGFGGLFGGGGFGGFGGGFGGGFW